MYGARIVTAVCCLVTDQLLFIAVVKQVMELGLHDIDKEVLSNVFSYLPKQGLASLVSIDKTTKTLLDAALTDNSFWKQRVETLIEKHIYPQQGVVRDWKAVYEQLLRGNYLSVAIIYDYVEIVEAYLRDVDKSYNMDKIFLLAVSHSSIIATR